MKKCCIELRRAVSVQHTQQQRKENYIGHIWLTKCLLQQVFEGKIEGRNMRKKR
jgi:hypothetical protein